MHIGEPGSSVKRSRSNAKRNAESARPQGAAKSSRKVSASSDVSFPVVGVGASAGGLAAVSELLKQFPPKVGLAVVVIQHLDPKHGSLTTDILSRVSAMPVAEVQDGMRLELDHVYVIPPNYNMRLLKGVLKLSPRSETRGQHLPIDLFFRSLAEDRKGQAIGVVLSGIASDGTMGMQAIKAEGGFTFAQDPPSAQYDGMPRSAILSGAVDIVETPAGIAREIARMSGRFVAHPAGARLVEPPTTRGPNGSIRKILALIRKGIGVDFTHYKLSTIHRRIARRLVLLKIEGLSAYAAYLALHPEEVKALFADILIHVTGFFRDPEAYENLQTQVLPKYMENCDPAMPFRVWVPGCSSGEEAYSIAIVFFECLDKAKVRPSLQIFASDISEQSLQKARAGVYPASIVKDVSKIRLNRFFEKMEGGGYRIAKWVRDTCLFSRHDVTADPPFAKIDLISCRNLLIYFAPELQKRVVPILHYALNPGGILWLGRSETLEGFRNLFTIEDKTNKFYSKKNVSGPVKLQFPAGRLLPELLTARKGTRQIVSLHDVQVEADRLAIQQYAPPGVVINDAADILQVHGRTAPFVELAPGQATLNLFKLAHPEIVSDLRYLINSARRENAEAKKDRLTLKKKNDRRSFGIRVVPLRLVSPSHERYFSIFFEQASGPVKAASQPPDGSSKKGQRRTEQQHTDDQWYQHQLIEDYETTQEELISSNEELLATNEELQSTNEELETAKEELQSTNEEITTINEELQHRNVEMSQLSNDLTNLLASVDIPIVMVGPDAKIRRFTPRAGQTLNLILGDVGRPIGDIKPAFEAPDLDDVVAEVMAELSVKEFETKDKEGTWYRFQARPYRTADNRIDGAVISLTDITILKRAAEELKVSHGNAIRIIETMPTPILVIGADRRVQVANDAFYNMFQVKPSETFGKFLSELCDSHWNIPPLLAQLESVLVEGVAFHDFEVDHEFPRVGHKYMLLHSTSTRLTGPGTYTALLAIEDLTLRKQTADQLRYVEERYRHLLENANDGIVIANQDGMIEFANRRVEGMFGYSPGELTGQNYNTLMPDQYRQSLSDYHAAYVRDPEARDMGRGVDLYGQRKDGTIFPVEISLSPVRLDSKLIVTAIVRDISERKKIEAERQGLLSRETDLRREAERTGRVKDEFLATLSHELRTPLTTILSWTQLLKLGKIEPEKAQRAFAVIERSAKDQGQLIDDLLDVSRIQAGKVSLELREIELTDCIGAVLDSVQSIAENKSVQIQTEFDHSTRRIMADYGRMQQVFRNLLTNAIKFTPPGGKITVRSRLRKDPDRFEIDVEDTGKGITPEFLLHLFTRFSQEDSSTQRVFGGIGLGLSIVRSLVEMHGGTVTASSPGENKGAVFTVTLPCVALGQNNGDGTFRSPQKAMEKTVDAPDLRGLRVLVVDDVEEAREAFSTMLRSVGAQVETAGTSLAGLAALASFKPDVVLCDIAMPGEDGFAFIHEVRSLKPDQGGKTAAAAVTAYAGPENVRRSLEAGFDAHLAKPLDAVELCRLVAKLAGRPKKQSQF